MSILSPEELRNAIVLIHELATGNWVQSDAELLRRIGKRLDKVIQEDDIMKGFLGYGGPYSGNDLITGTGGLSEKGKSNV